MQKNTTDRKLRHDRREYRKYAPWIFFTAEMILAVEIFYITNVIIGIGHVFLMCFICVGYFRLNKLFSVLDRQKKLKKS